MKRQLLTAALAALAAATPAAAQQKKPCAAPIFRQFDFWAGDWDVYSKNAEGEDVKAGENAITIEEGGCLLVERWTGSQGGTGQSYNFVDHASGKWRQVWVSPGTTIDYEGGLNDEGEMVLVGEIAYGNGKKAPFKGSWTLLDDGTVRQYFQQYDAEKDVWNDWFTGIYRKKAAEEE